MSTKKRTGLKAIAHLIKLASCEQRFSPSSLQIHGPNRAGVFANAIGDFHATPPLLIADARGCKRRLTDCRSSYAVGRALEIQAIKNCEAAFHAARYFIQRPPIFRLENPGILSIPSRFLGAEEAPSD